MVATDSPDVRAAVDRLVRERIPVVTLVSDLTGSQRHHFAGIDNIAAGRTAASLMGRFLAGRERATVAVLAGSMLVRDHRERLEGFRKRHGRDFADLAILPVIEGQDDPDVVYRLVVGCARGMPASPASTASAPAIAA